MYPDNSYTYIEYRGIKLTRTMCDEYILIILTRIEYRGIILSKEIRNEYILITLTHVLSIEA